MKIQYASDFHLENKENTAYLGESPLQVAGDILLLAGDVFVMGKDDDYLQRFLDWCSESFTRTLIVPGNHEFYGGEDIKSTLGGWELKLRDNVSCLNNKRVVVDGVELIFTTLWGDVPAEAESIVNKYMPECSSARYGQLHFKACHYGEVHAACRLWLDKVLNDPLSSRRVVVTHHCPVRVEDPKYESNGLSHAFVNPMEGYVEASGVDAWIFGHTHYNGARGTRVGGTVLCTNQLGYAAKGVCDGFSRSCVVEV